MEPGGQWYLELSRWDTFLWKDFWQCSQLAFQASTNLQDCIKVLLSHRRE